MIDEVFYLANTLKKERCYNAEKANFGSINKKIVYSITHPLMGENHLEELKKCFFHHVNNIQGLLASYSCVLGHYNIIKQAYDRGLNCILVLEDDLKPINLEILNRLPNDADIIKFFWKLNPDGVNYVSDGKEFTETRANSSSMQAYVFSRKAMKAYIDFMDKKLNYADSFTWESELVSNGELKQYFCNEKVFRELRLPTSIGYKNII